MGALRHNTQGGPARVAGASDPLLTKEQVRDIIYGEGSGVGAKNIYKLSSLGIAIRGTGGVRVRLKPTFRPNGTRWRRSDVDRFLEELNRRAACSGACGDVGEADASDEAGEREIESSGSTLHRCGLREDPRRALNPALSRDTTPAKLPRGVKPLRLVRCSDAEIGTYPTAWERKREDDLEAARMPGASHTDGEGTPGLTPGVP